jgi:hypothetical protein
MKAARKIFHLVHIFLIMNASHGKDGNRRPSPTTQCAAAGPDLTGACRVHEEIAGIENTRNAIQPRTRKNDGTTDVPIYSEGNLYK